MTNDEYADRVSMMGPIELLDEVMANPEYLTDGYYRPRGDTLRARYQTLVTEACMRRLRGDAPCR